MHSYAKSTWLLCADQAVCHFDMHYCASCCYYYLNAICMIEVAKFAAAHTHSLVPVRDAGLKYTFH